MVQGFLNTIMTIFNSILTFSSIGWGVLTGATGAAEKREQADLDGVVTYLEERLYESMAIAAEGV